MPLCNDSSASFKCSLCQPALRQCLCQLFGQGCCYRLPLLSPLPPLCAALQRQMSGIGVLNVGAGMWVLQDDVLARYVAEASAPQLPNPNQRDHQECTPLHVALLHGAHAHTHALAPLLHAPGSWEAWPQLLCSPVQAAGQLGGSSPPAHPRTHAASWLPASLPTNGPHQPCCVGQSACARLRSHACPSAAGQLEAARALLECGATLDRSCEGSPPLHLAVCVGGWMGWSVPG